MVLCSEKDLWHKAVSKRQAVMQEHESLARTAFQMSAELVSLKDRPLLHGVLAAWLLVVLPPFPWRPVLF